MKEIFIRPTGSERTYEKKELNKEEFSEPKLDLNILNKKSNSKTYSGWLISRIKKASKEANLELALIIQSFYKKYKEYEEIGKVEIKSWKGKSGIIDIIKKPEKIIVIRMQKPNKDSKPKEVRIEISKNEINTVIIALNKLRENQPIKTKNIAMIYSRLLNLKHSDWQRFFSDRSEHNKLTNILDVLDKEKLIKYSGGLTTILKDKLEFK